MPSKYQRDYIRCMDVYGPMITSCKGGRVVVKGYACPHCNSTDPPRRCDEPLSNNEKYWD